MTSAFFKETPNDVLPIYWRSVMRVSRQYAYLFRVISEQITSGQFKLESLILAQNERWRQA